MTHAPNHCGGRKGRRGMILVEVVLAMGLAFVAMLFVLDGLSSSVRAVSTAQREAVAADLVATILSELRLGLRDMEDAGPEAFEEEALEEWTWEIAVSELEDAELEMGMTQTTTLLGSGSNTVPAGVMDALLSLWRVEVVVRHTPSGVAWRIGQWMDAPLVEEGDGAEPPGDTP